MAINQRDVYLLPAFIGSRQLAKDHLFIVLSTKKCNDQQKVFVAVMISSSDKTYDDYSFDLTDDMFEYPLHIQGSHVRMHFFTLAENDDIFEPRKNRMHEKYFKQLMKSIGEYVFDYIVTPREEK